MILLTHIYRENEEQMRSFLPQYFKKHVLYLYDELTEFIFNPYIAGEQVGGMDEEVKILPKRIVIEEEKVGYQLKVQN